MGMFDEIRCLYPLPDGFVPKGGAVAQTKDTDAQSLDLYEIRADGTIWQEVYDIEDQSDPSAEGLMRYAGCMTRVNKRWEPSTHHGLLHFYYYSRDLATSHEYDALFDHGKLLKIEVASRPF